MSGEGELAKSCKSPSAEASHLDTTVACTMSLFIESYKAHKRQRTTFSAKIALTLGLLLDLVS